MMDLQFTIHQTAVILNPLIFCCIFLPASSLLVLPDKPKLSDKSSPEDKWWISVIREIFSNKEVILTLTIIIGGIFAIKIVLVKRSSKQSSIYSKNLSNKPVLPKVPQKPSETNKSE